jgi:hypothetical protein
VVGRGVVVDPDVQFTVELLAKLDPVTVRVTAVTVPAGALVGEIDVTPLAPIVRV